MRTLILTFFILSAGTMVSADQHKDNKESFILYDDGCEHPANGCAKAKKLPAKLKKEKKYTSQSDYLGSVQTQFSDKNEAGIDAWDHYFANAKSCEAALTKQQEDCSKQ